MAALAAALVLLAACGDDTEPGAGATPTPEENGCVEGEPVTTDSGLVIEELECGDGEAAERGQTIVVHYRGTFEDGEQFDASYDRDQPFPFTLGAGMVIQGWDEGLVGMQVGGKRKLTIPPELAYGETGQGPIPPNSTLIFEVELLEIQST